MSLLPLYYIQISSYEGLKATGAQMSALIALDVVSRTMKASPPIESIPSHAQPCRGVGNATQWLNTCTMCVEPWIDLEHYINQR